VGEFFQSYNDITVLQREMEDMDDAEQRRFMRRLSMETHVALAKHIESDAQMAVKVEQMHAALFDPMDGLVNLRKWMCRIATRAGVIFVAACGSIASLAAAGHSIGWW
jgi:hypothetical protein